MDSKQSTPAGIDLWVAVFLDRYPQCLKDLKRVDGPHGCMHKAADEADIALDEFNRRFPAATVDVSDDVRQVRDALDMILQESAAEIYTAEQLVERFVSVAGKSIAMLDSALVTPSN